MYSIGKLASEYGLSRGTLLHYDRIGLLSPSGRSNAGYRLYSERDRARLKQICHYRNTGLKLDEIRLLLEKGGDTSEILRQRCQLISQQISQLKKQQNRLLEMLNSPPLRESGQILSKAQWVAILRNCGMDDDAMWQWHREFERAEPEAHTQFLQSLGIDETEIQHIKARSVRAI